MPVSPRLRRFNECLPKLEPNSLTAQWEVLTNTERLKMISFGIAICVHNLVVDDDVDGATHIKLLRPEAEKNQALKALEQGLAKQRNSLSATTKKSLKSTYPNRTA